jgi:hypothetical protein
LIAVLKAATESYLAGATLKSLPGLEPVAARSLWLNTGAVIMAVRRPG